MKVFELSKEFDVTNKEMIDFLKGKGFKVSSHSQMLSDEMVETARKDFVKKVVEKVEEETPAPAPKKATRKSVPPKNVKKFAPDDRILCRSVVPWPIVKPGLD